MPHRALIERRPYLLLSLALAIAYFFASDGRLPGLWLIAWKGACVGVLAIYAWERGRGADTILITAVMALGALGDIGIEILLEAGAFFFMLAHVLAVVLFRRNRREHLTFSQRLAAYALLLGTPLLAFMITYPLDGFLLATAYAAVLGLMAACAWVSRFSRYQVGVGAVLFVVSDLLILAREAGRIDAGMADWFVWPLYYTAQFLIVTGVIQRLRGERHAPEAV